MSIKTIIPFIAIIGICLLFPVKALAYDNHIPISISIESDTITTGRPHKPNALHLSCTLIGNDLEISSSVTATGEISIIDNISGATVFHTYCFLYPTYICHLNGLSGQFTIMITINSRKYFGYLNL